MNTTLLKALIVLVLAVVLSLCSASIFLKKKGLPSSLQLIGAVFLIVVAIVHIFEALQIFTFMHWGSSHSVGHYLDFSSAILGITLFSTGLLLRLSRK